MRVVRGICTCEHSFRPRPDGSCPICGRTMKVAVQEAPKAPEPPPEPPAPAPKNAPGRKSAGLPKRAFDKPRVMFQIKVPSGDRHWIEVVIQRDGPAIYNPPEAIPFPILGALMNGAVKAQGPDAPKDGVRGKDDGFEWIQKGFDPTVRRRPGARR